jgi:hypothetical protein
MLTRDGKIGLVILLQMRAAGLAVEQHERSEVRKFQTFVKDQGGLHAAVGQEDAAVALRQIVPVLRHWSLRRCEAPLIRSFQPPSGLMRDGAA